MRLILVQWISILNSILFYVNLALVKEIKGLPNQLHGENNILPKLRINYRPATPTDVAFARKILLNEWMNPFSLQYEHMIVATTTTSFTSTLNAATTLTTSDTGTSTNGVTEKVVGFGQIRPIGFLKDSTKSLLSASSSAELASLYVDPQYRHNGIATSIIEKLLDRYDIAVATKSKQDNFSSVVVLLTLQPTAKLYEKHGFYVTKDVSKLPFQLQIEAFAGAIISSFLRNELVCMVRQK